MKLQRQLMVRVRATVTGTVRGEIGVNVKGEDEGRRRGRVKAMPC